EDEFLAFVPKLEEYESLATDNVKIISLSNHNKSYLKRLSFDYFQLPVMIEKEAPDVVFTMGNFAAPVNIPQGVLFMWPYAIYPDFQPIWDMMSSKRKLIQKLRIFFFKVRLKYADLVFPQTATSKVRLQKFYAGYINNMEIVPMAYSQIESTVNGQSFFNKQANTKYLLCLTRYYVHKNVEILISLAEKIKINQSNLKIVSTIGTDQDAKAAEWIDDIKEKGLDDIILNVGPVKVGDVQSLYEQVDGLILPTLLESFSATYVDSMYYGKPIFTSDLDFARDACGEAAFYFDPFNSDQIFETITAAFADEQKLSITIAEGKKRIQQLPDWNEVARKYIKALKSLALD
ncbi:MAG: glycosyltransferase, partial [Saprospiraceae bacterium]|nr:glycosyltransferase [Saprospiraceae bacterium]